jgi:hypothetical protein
MPDFASRKETALLADPGLTEKDAERYAEVTAGLKPPQMAAILAPAPPAEEERSEREAFIVSLLGSGTDAKPRAQALGPHRGPLARRVRALLAPGAAEPITAGGRTRPPRVARLIA